MTEFEKGIKALALDLEVLSDNYTADMGSPALNGDGSNTNYFKGKRDAYQYAANKLRDLLQWHGVTDKKPT